MSEASPNFQPRPPPAAPRRAKAILRPVPANGRCAAVRAPPDDEPWYPLDPPLVDVRMPLKPPHAVATTYSCSALMHRFPHAEVGDDLMMAFTEPGQREQSRLSPDVMVALNVPRGTRPQYDADRLGPPDFVLEVLSESTWRHDLGRKLDCYQQLGVRECLLFNATGKSLPQVDKELWGFSLTPRRREPLEQVALPNGERGVHSAVLGLVAYVAERKPPSGPEEIWALTMRWHDPATLADIPDYDQSRAEAQSERTRADAAERGMQTQRTRADAERTRADAAERGMQTQRARADAERTRADAAEQAIQAERARAAAAERRIAEQEEQLRRLRGGP